jgi:hypothetical protein
MNHSAHRIHFAKKVALDLLPWAMGYRLSQYSQPLDWFLQSLHPVTSKFPFFMQQWRRT